MFMNKVSISQTCLYNFSYKKATRFLQQPVAKEGIHSAIVQHNTYCSAIHSRVTVGGCSMEYEYKVLYQHFIYLYNIAAEPHDENVLV